MGRWEETFGEIVQQLRAIRASTIVEFGSGVSSIRLALEFPDAHIVAIESNREWHETVLRMRAEHGVEKRLMVHCRPLRWQSYGFHPFRSYAPGELPAQIDGVIIDGPPTWTRRGREACLYQVISCLQVGGVVLLDDYGRNREKKMVRNWTWSFPGAFEVQTIETGHGLCVMKKVAHTGPARPAMRTWPDHMLEAAGLLLQHPLRRE